MELRGSATSLPPADRSRGHSEDVEPEVILALAGLISSIGAILATFFGNRGDKDCEESLRLARLEAEDYARQVHDLRMRNP